MAIVCTVTPGVVVENEDQANEDLLELLGTPAVTVPVATKEQAEAGESNWEAMTPLRMHEAFAAILGEFMRDGGYATFSADGSWTHPLPGTMLPVLIKAVGGGGGGLGTGNGGNGANTVVSGVDVTVTARGGYGGEVSGSPHGATRGFPIWGAVVGPLGIGIYGGGGSTVSSGTSGQAGEALCVAIETDDDLTVVIGAGGTAGAGGGGAGQDGYVVLEW